MSWVTILWSAATGVCLMLALLHLFVWFQDRRAWANFCFTVMVMGVIGLLIGEMTTMHTESVAVFGRATRLMHLVYALVVAGCLGFVHFYFGTGLRWLLGLALGLRLLAVLANFTTGVSLHISEIHSLEKVMFLGEQVSMLGVWAGNPWVLLGQFAAFTQLAYVVDASVRLWHKGSRELRQRALILGGCLAFFIILAPLQSGLVVAGVLKMPFVVSFPFLGMALAMGYELSRDVLRAAQLARDLRESEQRMTLAAESANLGIWIRDLERNEIWATDRWRALFGFGKSERLNLDSILQRMHPDDREVVRHALAEASEDDGSYETEYRIMLPDGKLRWIASQARVEINDAGKPILVRGVSLDITERKVAEQETARHRQELAHLSRVSILGELAGALAHELNQPLAAMLSNSQVGRRSLDAAQPDLIEMAAILDDISADAKRAGGIIHGMRAMFKKDTAVESHAVDLNEAVNQVLNLLHSEIVARKAKVELHSCEPLPPVNAGRVEIQQVLLNLILNGLDAVKTGNGSASIRITAVRQDGHVIVSVRDHGPGIAPEMMGRLFEPFATTKAGGLGLGLAISRSIAARLGGDLLAENHPEGGAVFRLVLPAVDEQKVACQ